MPKCEIIFLIFDLWLQSHFHLKVKRIFRKFTKKKFELGAFPSSGWSGQLHTIQGLSYPLDNMLSQFFSSMRARTSFTTTAVHTRIYFSHQPSVPWTYLKDTMYIFIIRNSSQPLCHRCLQHITALSDNSLIHFSQFNSSRFEG